jgi:hypothetical protein
MGGKGKKGSGFRVQGSGLRANSHHFVEVTEMVQGV